MQQRAKCAKTLVKVYMAGKVTGPRGAWRGDLAECDNDIEQFASTTKDYKSMFTYMGPYALRCDHVAGVCTSKECKDGKAQRVVRISTDQIESAHLLLARIDNDDVRGTFAEIGFAAALKKRVILDIHPDIIDQLWFLVELALQNPPRASDFEAVADFVEFIPKKFRTPEGYSRYLRFILTAQDAKPQTGADPDPFPIRHPESGAMIDEVGFDCDGNFHHLG
jgi:nucleoside 2-deoxyribosyltransferase